MIRQTLLSSLLVVFAFSGLGCGTGGQTTLNRTTAAAALTSDLDKDGIPDVADADDDNDGVSDGQDADDDNDGVEDAEDVDDDNDGVSDSDEKEEEELEANESAEHGGGDHHDAGTETTTP